MDILTNTRATNVITNVRGKMIRWVPPFFFASQCDSQPQTECSLTPLQYFVWMFSFFILHPSAHSGLLLFFSKVFVIDLIINCKFSLWVQNDMTQRLFSLLNTSTFMIMILWIGYLFSFNLEIDSLNFLFVSLLHTFISNS